MKQHLNIVHTVSNDQWGGLERRVYNECLWMSQKGHFVTLLTPPHAPLYQKSKKQGWQTLGIHFKGVSAVQDLFRIRCLMKKCSPHVFNTHGNMDAKVGLTAIRGLNIPCVILGRHITPPVKNSWYNRLLYRQWCDYVFTTARCASSGIVKDLGVPAKRVHTVSSGIMPPDRMLPREEAQKALAQTLGLKPATRFIGYIGRLDTDKGLSDLILAFAKIKDRIPDHCLVLVGEGGARENLEQMIKDLGMTHRIRLAGFQKDPWPFYRAFDCKVLASVENEGIAQTLLEAMFAGCPVIGTNVGGIPDVLLDRKTGLLVPPKNPKVLAEKLMDTLENREETSKRVDHAYKFVKAGHTVHAMGHRILNLIEGALSKSRESGSTTKKTG